jgi:hypothetical protein
MATGHHARRLGIAALALLLVPAALIAFKELPFAGVSLKVSKEVAPPGGIAQIKISVTEPKPISTGSMFMDFGANDFVGIAALSPQNDAYGVADIRGSRIGFSLVSPTASLGTESDYPILTVATRVPATAALGSILRTSIAAGALRLIAPTGAVYPTDIDDGTLTVNHGISIDDVTPGSADLPAGGIVTIVGRGFRPSTKVRFGEIKLASVRYVDATHMQAVLKSAARMHGVRIRAENTDGAKTTYFSYQRTQRQGTSVFPTLQHLVPLFPLQLVTRAILPVHAVSTALALQNIAKTPASVVIQLLAPGGQVVATTVVPLGANRFSLQEVSELFGVAYSPPASVRVTSVVPIQVLGVGVDASGDATPLAPQS